MIGNVIGDLAGSIYEYEQLKDYHSVYISKLIEDNAFFSDDTILTVAVADAILTRTPYETKLKEYTKKYKNYKPNFEPYFKTAFSPNFIKWAEQNDAGTSNGNGALMRVAPVGFLFNNENDVIKNAYLATIPSHNNPIAIKSAQIVALIILYARNGLTKEQIKNKLNLNIYRPFGTGFNTTCEDTLEICLYSFFNSNSFEEAIARVISFGGDTDTNACIVGGMAEALWGVDSKLKSKAMNYLPKDFQDILSRAYAKVENRIR